MIECNGQTLEAIDYPVLASVIGNTYGPTNGLNGRAYGVHSWISLDATLNGRVLVDYEADYLSITALQMGQLYWCCRWYQHYSGEVDLLRDATNPQTITNGTANLANGTGVSGTGLQLSVSCNCGRVGIDSIIAPGSGFAAGNQFTIPASLFGSNAQEDVVLEVQWVLPSVGCFNTIWSRNYTTYCW